MLMLVLLLVLLALLVLRLLLVLLPLFADVLQSAAPSQLQRRCWQQVVESSCCPRPVMWRMGRRRWGR